MDIKTVKTAALKVAATDDAVRRLCMGVLTAWGLASTAMLAADGSGAVTLWLTGPFLLFGVGLGLVVIGFWKSEMAFRVAVTAGGGLAGVTAISELLMLAGAFHPVAVVGIETGVLALLWVAREWWAWKTTS